MATFQLNIRNDVLAEIEVNINEGSAVSTPYVEILQGATVLVTINLDADSFAAPSSGSMSANNLPKTGTAGNTGTAGSYRIYDRNQVMRVNGSCSVTGGGAEMELDSLSITSGNLVTLNTLTISFT